MYSVTIVGGTSWSMHRPHKSMILVVRPRTRRIEGGTTCIIIYQYSKRIRSKTHPYSLASSSLASD